MYEQFTLELDWGREPWGGVSPRALTYAARTGIGTCVVDNFDVQSPGREAKENLATAAQIIFFLQGKSDG